MNCQRFESQLELFLAEKLPSAVMQECRAHLESCSPCSELRVLCQNEMILADPAESERLVQAILQQTSRGACNKARELLPEQVDGLLSGSCHILLQDHLEHCSSCRQFHQVLDELKEELPLLEELDPGRDFTFRVLQASRPLLRQRSRGEYWSRRIWRRLLSRPRLAWEAAYVLTLMIFALSRFLTFIPGWPSVESIRSLQAKPAQVWKSTASNAKENWAQYLTSIAAKQELLAQASASKKIKLAKGFSLAASQTQQNWQSASAAARQMHSINWTGITDHLNRIWGKRPSLFSKFAANKKL